MVSLTGRIAPPPARLYEFDGAASGSIRQNLPLDAFARETGLALKPFSVLQLDSSPPANDGLLRDWLHPAADVHKHYGYALQWFALAALTIGLYVWFQILRPRRRPR
jgi:surfeit locus 1 family protein